MRAQLQPILLAGQYPLLERRYAHSSPRFDPGPLFCLVEVWLSRHCVITRFSVIICLVKQTKRFWRPVLCTFVRFKRTPTSPWGCTAQNKVPSLTKSNALISFAYLIYFCHIATFGSMSRLFWGFLTQKCFHWFPEVIFYRLFTLFRRRGGNFLVSYCIVNKSYYP